MPLTEEQQQRDAALADLRCALAQSRPQQPLHCTATDAVPQLVRRPVATHIPAGLTVGGGHTPARLGCHHPPHQRQALHSGLHTRLCERALPAGSCTPAFSSTSARPEAPLAPVITEHWHPANGELAAAGGTNTSESQHLVWCACRLHTHTTSPKALMAGNSSGYTCKICKQAADSEHELPVRDALRALAIGFQVYPGCCQASLGLQISLCAALAC
jgi:hypothetical protein